MLACVLAFSVCIWAADDLSADVRLKEEVSRHVFDECDLYSIHKKNRIDFNPLNIPFPERTKGQHRVRDSAISKIVEVVQNVPSFYKRAIIYNVYYEMCLQSISIEDAETEIARVVNRRISDDNIRSLDREVSLLYSTRSNKNRVRRDEAKIKLLRIVGLEESDPKLRHKINSVIRELEYDIELWKF